MPRTPDQVAADNALTEAIEAHQHAYHDSNEGVLTDYLVIAERTFWNDEGDKSGAVYISVLDNDSTITRQLGLIEFAAAKVRHAVNDE